MGDRWHMNRMGFVNFWLYDEEVFSFADGKLLLRGQNGSGKSITTQSFIPFILDGDRTPSRLDPFGSSDRRMEYYFLGDGEKEEATGYLFLEFQKGNRYRTIGIGQQAKKGKSMGFWGFVVLDGRRIGYDIQLYREVGGLKIACTKQELKKLLGDENPFTEAQKEYMALVNKYIFGFPRMELYEQFIRLLIKVRAPKLSKEFKPTKVYEILNDSLQTLSDEDLRAMVDAMEKMDDIQDRLDGLKQSCKDLQIIRNEYTKYNRYMLAQKAAAYLEEKRQADEAKGELSREWEELKTARESLIRAEKRSRELLEEQKLLEGEREAIGITGLEEADEKLRQCRKRIKEAEREIAGYEKEIERHRETMREHDRNLREIRKQIEGYEAQIGRLVRDMEELEEEVRFSGHEEAVSCLKTRADSDRLRELKKEAESLSRRVSSALAELKSLEEIRKKWDQVSEELEHRTEEAAKAEKEFHDAELMEDRERDRLIEAYYDLEQKNGEYYLEKEELEQLSALISRYLERTDFGPVRRLTGGILDQKKRTLENARSDIRLEKDKKELRIENCREELEELGKTPEMTPLRRETTRKARACLKKNGIPFLAFYEAVDFSEGISPKERAMFECQMEDIGFLDALIVPEKDLEKSVRLLGDWADKIIRVEKSGDGVCRTVRAVTEDSGLREMTERILSDIGTEADAGIVLRPDGYFKHGALEGYSRPEREACYIGEAVRQEKKQELIREKEEELRRLLTELETMKQEIGLLTERILLLQKEYDGLPRFDDLDQAIDLKRNCSGNLEAVKGTCRKKEMEWETCEEEKRRQEQRVIVSCRELPYERTVSAFEALSDVLQDYRELMEELQAAVMYAAAEREKQEIQHQLLENEEEAVDREDLQKKRVEREKKEQCVQADRLEEFLSSPENQEKARRLHEIREELLKRSEEEKELGKHQAVWENEIRRLEPAIKDGEKLVLEKVRREERFGQYFEEELKLGLVFSEEDQTTVEAAGRARGLLGESERNRSVTDVVSNLDRIFHGHNGSLVTYGTFMEECFGEDGGEASVLRKRHRILSYVQGKPVYFEEFYKLIKEKIEETELLIRQKDRELFENILSDTLSRKLNARIAESRRWIQDMSALMRKMDTSMSLSFSLDWKAKNAEGEGELNTAELEKLLNRDKELLTTEDIEKISVHFRNKIYMVKQMAEENGDVVSYMDLVREALDYRKWFEFRMYYYRNEENRRELTNAAFNRFSGGEKAMAMYVPLFAAVNAQYKKAERDDLPRMIALDEAFAGVDDKNISSMFELVRKFDFDYIMNSQVLWGCYPSIPALRIAELLRPSNSQVVTVIYYLWNGKQKIIEEQ